MSKESIVASLKEVYKGAQYDVSSLSIKHVLEPLMA